MGADIDTGEKEVDDDTMILGWDRCYLLRWGTLEKKHNLWEEEDNSQLDISLEYLSKDME